MSVLYDLTDLLTVYEQDDVVYVTVSNLCSGLGGRVYIAEEKP